MYPPPYSKSEPPQAPFPILFPKTSILSLLKALVSSTSWSTWPQTSLMPLLAWPVYWPPNPISLLQFSHDSVTKAVFKNPNLILSLYCTKSSSTPQGPQDKGQVDWGSKSCRMWLLPTPPASSLFQGQAWSQPRTFAYTVPILTPTC